MSGLATERVYLGDAVYAELDDAGRLWLHTSNGQSITNSICLEPEVLSALMICLATWNAKEVTQ